MGCHCHIMQNARLDEAQAGIEIAGRNINNLKYTNDTTLMGENEELMGLLMKVKVTQLCPTLCDPMDTGPEYWSG